VGVDMDDDGGRLPVFESDSRKSQQYLFGGPAWQSGRTASSDGDWILWTTQRFDLEDQAAASDAANADGDDDH
jgi:hypothetical protein